MKKNVKVENNSFFNFQDSYGDRTYGNCNDEINIKLNSNEGFHSHGGSSSNSSSNSNSNYNGRSDIGASVISCSLSTLFPSSIANSVNINSNGNSDHESEENENDGDTDHLQVSYKDAKLYRKVKVKVKVNEDASDGNVSETMKNISENSMCKLKKTGSNYTTTTRWKCNLCSKELGSQSGIIAHIHNSHRQYVINKMNGVGFLVDNIKLLKNDSNEKIRKLFLMTNKFNYQCKKCDKIVSTRSGAISHANIHLGIKKYICKYCQRRFASKTTKDRHELRHTGEKPFECHLCHRRFAVKSVLVTHMVTHTREKNYHCKLCQKKYGQKSSLTRHTKKAHTNCNNLKQSFNLDNNNSNNSSNSNNNNNNNGNNN